MKETNLFSKETLRFDLRFNRSEEDQLKKCIHRSSHDDIY
uniref:Uncharacterized protein n=1 Tax=Anopheles dirus TaxID=7168 RepID=A0A182NYD7_9DIPT